MASLEHLKKGRRRALANIDLEKYRQIVLEMVKIDEEMHESVHEEVCGHLDISHETFRESYCKVHNDEASKERFMQMYKKNNLSKFTAESKKRSKRES